MGKTWVVGLVACVAPILALGTGCQSNRPAPLYDRLGGDMMINAIVEDFLDQVMGDPRVNFTRNGTSAEWTPSPENMSVLKVHLVEFFVAASGGPSDYDGKDMKSAHAGMQITDAQFDAAEQDLKKSLQKFDIAAQEQSELMTIVEGTRSEIVER